jgi:tetratricopeptide (TPR) repeat protein
LGAIAEAMARAGMWEQALRTAEAIEEAWERAWALRAIAEAMARTGMTQQALWEQALRTAEAIEELQGRAWALGAIAEAMARAECGSKPSGRQKQSRAWSGHWPWGHRGSHGQGRNDPAGPGSLPPGPPDGRSNRRGTGAGIGLGAIAEAMARAGMTQQAQEAFHQALRTAEAIEEAPGAGIGLWGHCGSYGQGLE